MTSIIRNLMLTLSGADKYLLAQVDLGKSVWATIGLNIFIAATLAGASATIFVNEIFPKIQSIFHLAFGIGVAFSVIFLLKRSLKFLLLSLKNLYLLCLLIGLLLLSTLLAAYPLEIKLILAVEPLDQLKGHFTYNYIKSWFLIINGPPTLKLLRAAIRVSCFIIFSLPFFVGWNARKGFLIQLLGAQQIIKNILTPSVQN